MFGPSDDDDDDFDPDPPQYPIGRPLALALLTAIGTGLVAWGIDELRERYGKTRQHATYEAKEKEADRFDRPDD